MMLKQHVTPCARTPNHAQGFVLVPLGQNLLRINSPTGRELRRSFFKVLSFHFCVASLLATPSPFNLRMNAAFWELYSFGTYAVAVSQAPFDFGDALSGSPLLEHFLFFTGGSTVEGSALSPSPCWFSTMLALYCLLMAKGSGAGGHAKVFSTSNRISRRLVSWTWKDISCSILKQYFWGD